jgi:hypothetical protein
MVFSPPIVIGLIGIFVTYVISIYRYNNLHKFPGPLFASFTPLWRVYHACFNRDRVMELELHEKYGPVVRAAPSVLSFSDPEIMRDVYIKNFHTACYIPLRSVQQAHPHPSPTNT